MPSNDYHLTWQEACYLCMMVYSPSREAVALLTATFHAEDRSRYTRLNAFVRFHLRALAIIVEEDSWLQESKQLCKVAIKIIEKFRLDQSDLKKIYREIQILKLLRHPHIMKLYEVIETKTKIHLVCEYASHGEVFDYITQEEKIPEEKARKLFYQVLTAVEYCHKHNVVHRDLKAENLLLDAHDNIKLADFGFGNFFQSGKNLNTWCGSPPYAAPEVFEGKLYEGPQLDIWSLGIVLYVLVCGTFPFDGSNLATLKERVLAGRFRIPYWMSQDCENLIRRMLVVNPKKRLTIAQIKKHRWLEPVTVKPDAYLRNCDSPSRRSAANQLPEYNELILKQIQTLGIDRQKTIDALRTSSYNHLYAIYHLLVDRLKNHRTSVPLETKLSYDGGKRRPSNIVEQTVTKRSFTTSPTSKLSDQFRNVQKPQGLTNYHHPQLRASNSARSADEHSPGSYVMTQRRDLNFVEDTGNDLPAIQRTLVMGAFQVPHMSQSPVSPSAVNKPKYITHPSRGALPHQPWSFNAGLGIRATYQTSPPHPLVIGQHQKGSGDVIPSVTSVDEGVELRSTSPSEQEMIKLANQHPRRHTLGIPESYLPFANLVSKSEEIALQTSAVGDGSRADSLYGSSGIGNAQDSDGQVESLDMSYDSTPRVVLSPCTDESSQPVQPQDSHVTYVENQRQLLDVSPTGFREGRRASDGLLLLGDNRIGEHLKKICRANQFPPINQEENDDNCFDGTEKEQENKRTLLRLMPDMRTNELGTMTSHSSHHVMQVPRSDVINFQPYASSNRRCSWQVPQCLNEERCSSYSKGFEAPLVHQHAAHVQPNNQAFHQSYDQANDDHYQWSSWKAVMEKELPDSDNFQQRRDTIPLLNRSNIGTGAFTVWSDDAVSKKSSLEYGARHSAVYHASGQSLVQALQRRRINRRRHIAQHVGNSPGSNYQLPELELLRIADGNFSNPGSTEELSGRFPTQAPVPQPFTTGSLEGYRGNSPDMLQNVFTDQRDHSVLVTTPHPSSPFQGQAKGGFSSWTETSHQSRMLHANPAMEFS